MYEHLKYLGIPWVPHSPEKTLLITHFFLSDSRNIIENLLESFKI